jgi:hypothetical protein
MAKIATHLASATITPLGDRLSVELIQEPDMPSTIRITWPPEPTSILPDVFAQQVAELGKLFGYAEARLAQIRGDRA